MLYFVISLILIVFLIFLYCCLKVASWADNYQDGMDEAERKV